MNITMERISSPPLAPETTLSPAQLAFLSLHVLHHVERWQWHWFETMLRAHAGRRSATIWRDAAEEMVAWGLMEWGHGCADMKPTAAGAGLVMSQRAAAKLENAT